ncbi:undecaprenyl-diphosphate phosphatase [Ammoniphilus resinae]|uniref:Undecaprenyl-diphosphatase n=1 Tax=Ammoniphilus resinae TaxID=861532 RepID=A0ABS4GK14_9BACL|nr:undecaprenyl-diphosphatase [Ammoniphilus resinae]
MEELLKSWILGIVQGLTEFLPISSTGHLVLFRKWFGLQEAGLFLDTMLHFGTFVAVLAVFWDDVIRLIKKPWSRLGLLILTGTIPTAFIGLTFEDFFEDISRTGETIGVEFLATGLILWFADNLKKSRGKDLDSISFKDAIFIGTLQGAAILPAISRSGLTIAGSLWRGIKREDAAKFSFLLSLPAILGGVILQGQKLFEEQTVSIGLPSLLVGTFAAAVAGYIAVRWMLKILREGSLKIFAVYVWILGIIIIGLQMTSNW